MNDYEFRIKIIRILNFMVSSNQKNFLATIEIFKNTPVNIREKESVVGAMEAASQANTDAATELTNLLDEIEAQID